MFTRPLHQTDASQLAKKNGPRAKLYMINGDTYIGEWKNDLKHGSILNFFITFF
jgi:hypothetical protein